VSEFPDRLLELIAALRIEQQELATVAGVHETTITQYKKGKTLPGFKVLAAWSGKYQVDLHWLVLGEGEMFRASGQATAPAVPSATDPIAQRVEVVAREMRAAGASDDEVKDAICRALDGRPALGGRYATGAGERREGFGRAAETVEDYPAEAEAEQP